MVFTVTTNLLSYFEVSVERMICILSTNVRPMQRVPRTISMDNVYIYVVLVLRCTMDNVSKCSEATTENLIRRYWKRSLQGNGIHRNS